MVRGRRRVTRSTAQKSPEPSVDPEHTSPPPNIDKPASRSQQDSCPACTSNQTAEWNAADKENWVRCDSCKTWYHWRCAGDGGDLERIDKWFCEDCLAKDPSRTVTLKAPARKSSRKRTQQDYANLHAGVGSDPNRWLRMLEGKPIQADNFRRMKGSEVNHEWLENDENAMREPIVIESPEGLGMKMPGKDFDVEDVVKLVGEDTPVEVMDVASQSTSPGWTLGRWGEYFNTEPETRDKIRNVISLEISGTKLGDMVLPPKLVRELDWVEKFWPNTRKGKGHAYPKVQLYCLMGVAQAWTDWHIDFAGSSVYYHILRGAKVFYFVKPTPINLAAYEKWSGTDMQSHTWLGDMVDEVIKIELTAGNTMIIPTGWIHAVYTPVDTLVFGGNFLHSYNVITQLRVREIEIATQVPKKFRFPMFSKLCWYAGERYLRDLKGKEEFSPRLLESIEALAAFLVSEVRIMERGSEQAKKEAKDQVPGDRIKDPPAMARELRWRVRLMSGYSSDEEGGQRRAASAELSSSGPAMKRKRSGSNSVEESRERFRNFKPRLWARITCNPTESDRKVLRMQRPMGEDAFDGDWMDRTEDGSGGGEQVEVRRRRDVIIKVRKVDGGFERQRIERTVEEWLWNGGDSKLMNGASTLDKMDVDSQESKL
ncbi:hypothetical protein JAAARDRAFT_125212 [Jaapia argillacea MUCL 33604]|uniref:JmjC domain-containing histone demethylation protein 1 n=1 Tax=Jaapia argillacea MUCL 33604 TaxID=933084 RepID=A0A067QD75_9AGAM|nr:hypothetical protein JAAARDRAFT_125212 [Jaapia argillacea MUCL 33604]